MIHLQKAHVTINEKQAKDEQKLKSLTLMF